MSSVYSSSTTKVVVVYKSQVSIYKYCTFQFFLWRAAKYEAAGAKWQVILM